ncbi:MAG: hypothetical protein QM765_41245 [Myxococcales bacterium]
MVPFRSPHGSSGAQNVQRSWPAALHSCTTPSLQLVVLAGSLHTPRGCWQLPLTHFWPMEVQSVAQAAPLLAVPSQ